MVLSSAIVCDHDRRIADDRRSVFPYDRRRSQNFLRSAICDPRSSAIIWKPALRVSSHRKLDKKFSSLCSAFIYFIWCSREKEGDFEGKQKKMEDVNRLPNLSESQVLEWSLELPH